MPSLEDLERRIGYSFADGALVIEALTHRSHANEAGVGAHNERFEFLGDAVLGFVVSDRLMKLYPEYPEGRLTKVKAQLVCSSALHRAAQALNLSDHILLGNAEERNGGRTKKALQGDTVEALLAAIYLDGGLTAASQFIDNFLLQPEQIAVADQNLEMDNAKSTLQELLQSRKLPLPAYNIVDQVGPPHSRVFSVELRIGDLYQTRAEGLTRKEAEQSVATAALAARDSWLPRLAHETDRPAST